MKIVGEEMTLAKHALSHVEGAQSSQSSENVFNFAPWRLGERNFLVFVSVRIFDIAI
jgi:hypothetical protein